MPISFALAKDWQKRNIFDSVVEVIADFDPDDIFDENALEKWALDNGFMYVKDCPEAE